MANGAQGNAAPVASGATEDDPIARIEAAMQAAIAAAPSSPSGAAADETVSLLADDTNVSATGDEMMSKKAVGTASTCPRKTTDYCVVLERLLQQAEASQGQWAQSQARNDGLAGCGGGRVAAGALKAKLPPGWEVFYEAIKSGKGAAEGREDIKVRAPDGTVYRSIVSAVRAIEAGHAGDAASAGAGGRRLSQKHFEGAHFLNALQEGLVAGSAVDARLVPVAFAGGGAGFAEQSDSDDDRGGDDGAGGEGGGGGCQSGGGGGGGLPLAAPPGGWRRRRGAVADVGGGAPATKRPRCCHR